MRKGGKQMEKYYARQVDPEFTEDDLFWLAKDNRLEVMDEVYAENIIIGGNRDFLSYCPDKLEKLEDHIEYFNSDLRGYYGEQGNLTELANYYFKKHNGKRWSKHELRLWRDVADLTESYSPENEKEAFKLALFLITGKDWTRTCIKGCSQRDYQYMWYSSELDQKDIDYIEMCYFNTGSRYDFFESKEDMDNDCPATSYYVSGYKSKEELLQHIGCKPEELEVWEFAGYQKEPTYKLAM